MVGAQCEIGAGFFMNESKSGEEFKLVSVSGESDGTRRSAGDNFGDAKSAFIILELKKKLADTVIWTFEKLKMLM